MATTVPLPGRDNVKPLIGQQECFLQDLQIQMARCAALPQAQPAQQLRPLRSVPDREAEGYGALLNRRPELPSFFK